MDAGWAPTAAGQAAEPTLPRPRRAQPRPWGLQSAAPTQTDDLSAAIALTRVGDEAAFRSVYRAVHPGLLRYLQALVGDDGEDVASETWLQIVRDLHTFNGDGTDFRAWAAAVARHRALDHLRARSRRPRTSEPLDALADRPADSDTAAHAIESLTTRAAIELIAGLPRDQAEAVLLRVVVGLDVERTARVLGKRPGAVRTAAYRGLRRLGGHLEHLDHGAEGDPDGGR